LEALLARGIPNLRSTGRASVWCGGMINV
jgi:hypothetical protein